MLNNSITKKYLNKSSKELFWLFLLVIPYLIWMYSITTELNKRIHKQNPINKILLNIFTGYTFIYLIFIWISLITSIIEIESIMIYNIGAMISNFALIVLTTITIIKFEKQEKLEQSNGFDLFLGIWFYIIGIWYLQPKLKKYLK